MTGALIGGRYVTTVFFKGSMALVFRINSSRPGNVGNKDWPDRIMRRSTHRKYCISSSIKCWFPSVSCTASGMSFACSFFISIHMFRTSSVFLAANFVVFSVKNKQFLALNSLQNVPGT